LLRRTYNDHICRFHTDAALAIDRVKQNFAHPTYVIDCRAAESENAIYALPVGGDPWIVVAVKVRWFGLKKRVISTWYACPQAQLADELKKGRQIFP